MCIQNKIYALNTNRRICITFSSFLMYIFDRWSPYSYQNNREKYADDDEKREFTMRECLWFCMTSLTPQVIIDNGSHLRSISNFQHFSLLKQGGGEAPKVSLTIKHTFS